MYRLFRISRIFKLLKIKSHDGVLARVREFLHLRHSAVRLISVFSTVLVCAHIIACIWVFIAKVDGYNPDTWVVRHEYRDDSDGVIYLASLYWTFTSMSTVGYGDITARTDMEQVLAIILMLFGVVFFSFVIGSISSIFSRIDTREA